MKSYLIKDTTLTEKKKRLYSLIAWICWSAPIVICGSIATYGFIFENCKFSHERNMEVYLGRPWYPGGAKEAVYPRISFINSIIPDDVFPYLKRMHEKDLLKYSFKIENCYIGGIK